MTKTSKEAHNRKAGIRSVNFICGYYVFKANPNLGLKLILRWTGSFKVTKFDGDYLFTMPDAVTKTDIVAHGRELNFYREGT